MSDRRQQSPPPPEPAAMRGRQPNPRGESLTPWQKRRFAIAGVVLIVLVAGVSIWAAASPGRYGRSSHGCVNIEAPSSTGGAILHECGADARALCRAAFSHASRLDLLARPQCRLAGLGPG